MSTADSVSSGRAPDEQVPQARRRALSGDRNQCGGCGEFFNSTFAFDKHRTGEFGKDRRCLTANEMRAKGMSTNAACFWISSAMPELRREAA